MKMMNLGKATARVTLRIKLMPSEYSREGKENRIVLEKTKKLSEMPTCPQTRKNYLPACFVDSF